MTPPRRNLIRIVQQTNCTGSDANASHDTCKELANALLAYAIEHTLGVVLELAAKQEEEHLKEAREHLVRPKARLRVLHLARGLEVA